MIAIAAPVFDIAGAMIFKNASDSDFDTVQRRISRTATLDGGAYVSDAGYSDADITLVVRVRSLTDAQAVSIRRLIENYSTLVATTPRAAYSVAPTGFTYRSGSGTLTLYVREKISE